MSPLLGCGIYVQMTHLIVDLAVTFKNPENVNMNVNTKSVQLYNAVCLHLFQPVSKSFFQI